MEISLLDMGKTKKRNVRESIIAVLSREFPLSIKKIYNKVKKEYGLDVTYQAVFKLVKEMVDDKVIEKDNSEYKLNMNWIKQLEDEITVIKSKYVGENKKSENSMQDRINDFIAKMGPKLKTYLGKDKCCIVTLSGTGYYYALNTWKYFSREGIDVKFVNVDKSDMSSGKQIKFNEEDFSNRKVLIIDYGIFSGTAYKFLMNLII